MPLRDVAGHRRNLALLARAIARQSLPPAFLLAGPQGIGKRRTALAVAQTLNCLDPLRRGPAPHAEDGEAREGTGALEIDACGKCDACRRIGRGVHADVIAIEAGDTGSIMIEQIRDVIDRAAYRPFEGRRRVVIVDEADAMRAPAQSALLKTLEEPPPASIFALVSSRPDALLPTVLSRCPRLRFGPLAAVDVAQVLMRDHGYDEAEARAAAADAGGSVGQALAARSLDAGEAREAARTVLERAARIGDPSQRMDAVKDLVARRSAPRSASGQGSRSGSGPAPRLSAGQAGERDQLAVCLRALASLLRDLGVLAAGAEPRLLANPDLQDALQRLTTSYDSDRSIRAFAAVDRALAALERNASPKIVADWVVLQL